MKLANLDLRLDRSRRRPYRPGRDACGHWSLSPQNSPREQPASVVFTDRLSMIAAVQFAARRPYFPVHHNEGKIDFLESVRRLADVSA